MGINVGKYGKYAVEKNENNTSTQAVRQDGLQSLSSNYSKSSSRQYTPKLVYSTAYKKAYNKGLDLSYYTLPTNNYSSKSYLDSLPEFNTRKAVKTSRSFLDRTFDVLCVGQYGMMGFLSNLFDDKGNVQIGEALSKGWEGIKAGNPFGAGNEDSEYCFADVLNKYWDWDERFDNYTKDMTGIQLKANQGMKFLTELSGDIFLDPLTYVSFGIDGLLKGTGATLGKASEKITADAVKQMAKKGGIELAEDAVTHYASKLNRLRGLNTSEKGITVFGKTLTDGSTMRAIGDRTVAPALNSLRNTIRTSSVARLVSNNAKLSKIAMESPETALKYMAYLDRAKALKLDKVISNKEARDFYKRASELLTGEENKAITDALENDELWTRFVPRQVDDSAEKILADIEHEANRISGRRNTLKEEVEIVDNLLDEDKFWETITSANNPEMQRIIKDIFDPNNTYQTYDDMLEHMGINDVYASALERENSFFDLFNNENSIVGLRNRLVDEIGEENAEQLMKYGDDFINGKLDEASFKQIYDDLYTKRLEQQRMYENLFKNAEMRDEMANQFAIKEYDELAQQAVADEQKLFERAKGYKESIEKGNVYNEKVGQIANEITSRTGAHPKLEWKPVYNDVSHVMYEPMSVQDYADRLARNRNVTKEISETTNDVLGFISRVDDSTLVMQSQVLKQRGVYNRIVKMPIEDKVKYLNDILFGGENVIAIPKNVTYKGLVEGTDDVARGGVRQVNEILQAIKDGKSAKEINEMAWRASHKGRTIYEELTRVYGYYNDMAKQLDTYTEQIRKLSEKKQSASVLGDARVFNKRAQAKLDDLVKKQAELSRRIAVRNGELTFAKSLTDDEYKIFRDMRGNAQFDQFDALALRRELAERAKDMQTYEASRLFDDLDDRVYMSYKESNSKASELSGEGRVRDFNNADQDALKTKDIPHSVKTKRGKYEKPLDLNSDKFVERRLSNGEVTQSLGEHIRVYDGVNETVPMKEVIASQQERDLLLEHTRNIRFNIRENIPKQIDNYIARNQKVLDKINNNSVYVEHAQQLAKKLKLWTKGKLPGAKYNLNDIIYKIYKMNPADDVVIYANSRAVKNVLEPFTTETGAKLTYNMPFIDGLGENATYVSLVAPQMGKRVYVKDALTGQVIASNVNSAGKFGYTYSVSEIARSQKARIVEEANTIQRHKKIAELVNKGQIEEASKLLPTTNKEAERVYEQLGFDTSLYGREKIVRESADNVVTKTVGSDLPDNIIEYEGHLIDKETGEIVEREIATKSVANELPALSSKELSNKAITEEIAKPLSHDIPENIIEFNGHYVDKFTGEVIEPLSINEAVNHIDPYVGRVDGKTLPEVLNEEAQIAQKFTTPQDVLDYMSKQRDAIEGELLVVDDLLNGTFKANRKEEVINAILEEAHRAGDDLGLTYADGSTKLERLLRSFDSEDVTMRQEVKEIATEIKERLRQMGVNERNAGALENMMENYMPHVINPELVNNPAFMKKLRTQEPQFYNEILKNSGSRFNPFNLSRNEKIKEVYGYSIREINDAIRPLLKQYGMDGDFFIHEATDAYLVRALKHNEIMYGSRFADELISEFGSAVTPQTIDLNKRYYLKTESIKNALTGLSNENQKQLLELAGFNMERGYNKSLISVKGEDYMNISRAFEKYTGHSPTLYDVPEYLATKAENLGFTQQFKDKCAFLKVYDYVTTLWKNAVTVATPGFHARNSFSNVFQNYLNVGSEVFNPKLRKSVKEVFNGVDGYLVTNSGKRISYQDIRNACEAYNVVGEGVFEGGKGIIEKSVINNEMLGDGTGVIQHLIGKDNPSVLTKFDPTDVKNFGLYEAGRRVGNNIEEYDRMLNFMANLKNDLDFLQASEMTDKFLFDYSDLTTFEKDFMRRIVPFYTWIKNNAPLQMEQLLTNPGAYRFVAKTTNELNDGYDMSVMPEFMQDWVVLPIQYKGDEVFLNPNMPYGQINDVAELANFAEPKGQYRRAVNMLNPIIKVPLELSQNNNSYFDEPIYDENGNGIGDYLMNMTGFLNNINKVNNTIKNGGDVNDYLNAFSYGTGIKTRVEDYDEYVKKAQLEALKRYLESQEK